jgi:tetratricopeptide (TPR) repeat protein
MRGALWLLACLAIEASACAHTPSPREHALVLLARGQTREGVIELERLRDANASDPQAWIDLGHAYELSHRYDDALAAYDRAADVAPTSPIGPREGGLRAAAWGELPAARARLEEAVKRGDDRAGTFHALGLVCLSQKDYDAARAAYLAGLAAKEGADDATNVLGLATLEVLLDHPKEALRWYDELLRRRPKLSAPWLGRAWALGKLGRIAEANRACDEAASLGSKPAEVERLRGWLASGAK